MLQAIMEALFSGDMAPEDGFRALAAFYADEGRSQRNAEIAAIDHITGVGITLPGSREMLGMISQGISAITGQPFDATEGRGGGDGGGTTGDDEKLREIDEFGRQAIFDRRFADSKGRFTGTAGNFARDQFAPLQSAFRIQDLFGQATLGRQPANQIATQSWQDFLPGTAVGSFGKARDVLSNLWNLTTQERAEGGLGFSGLSGNTLEGDPGIGVLRNLMATALRSRLGGGAARFAQRLPRFQKEFQARAAGGGPQTGFLDELKRRFNL